METQDVGCLLGDSAYALRTYLLTPFRVTRGRAQETYNVAHKRTRVKVEQTIGILKARYIFEISKLSALYCMFTNNNCSFLNEARIFSDLVY